MMIHSSHMTIPSPLTPICAVNYKYAKLDARFKLPCIHEQYLGILMEFNL